MRYNSSIKLKVGRLRCNKCAFKLDKPAEIRDHVEKVHAELQLTEEMNINDKLKF